jgi:hypothetical protein
MKTVAKICAVEKCETFIGAHGARGWCPKHYKRWKATGDPEKVTVSPIGSTPAERLRFYGWNVSPEGCWLFNGLIASDGYGVINQGRSPYRAHRAAYESWVGSIPKGYFVRHSCDTPRCINPLHLSVGTPAQNSQDAVDRKRMANGERHGCHILTDEEVSTIRGAYATSAISQRALAKQFRCSQAQINNILNFKQRVNGTWLRK